MPKKDKLMTYDFSHLYKRETVDIGLFSVTVREIPHGEMVALQESILGRTHLSSNKGEVQRQIEQITFSGPEFADQQALMGIESWTLQDSAGEPVPVCLEAWRALPHHITEAIEAAIEELNPEMDEEFPGEPGNGSESQGAVEDTA